MTQKTLVCRADEIAPGAPLIVKIRGLGVGLFKIGNDIHAMLNVCPHRGAPLCEGPQCGTTISDDTGAILYHRDNEIVRCAWHGWEFDIVTGTSLVDPKVSARVFPVSVDAGNVYVHV